MNTTYPSDLSDAEWACLQRHLPADLTRRRWPRHTLRRVCDAIFYLLRTGCPWRFLPADFPPWQTVYYHFRRFRLTGVWSGLLTALRQAERRRIHKQPQPSAAIMDAQSVKTVGESARISGYDGHKRVKGRKSGCPRILVVRFREEGEDAGAQAAMPASQRVFPFLQGRQVCTVSSGVDHASRGKMPVAQ
jgi:transposase